ncbi:hypothetical protein WQ54_19440 [Bacillus sp. SA1-12]|nr:hypothetical protein WQ54_19440 [Bacillus sp. SA1-12]
MSPVIGLDVAKGESQVQAYLDKKKPYKKSFRLIYCPHHDNVLGLHQYQYPLLLRGPENLNCTGGTHLTVSMIISG